MCRVKAGTTDLCCNNRNMIRCKNEKIHNQDGQTSNRGEVGMKWD